MSLPFTLYWHRAGNSAAGVAAVLSARRHGLEELAGRTLRHGLELDLKWASARGGPILYAHHGLTGRERLQATTVIGRAASGKLMLLEGLWDRPAVRSLHFLVELKCGDCRPEEPIARLAYLIQRHGLAGRTHLASSSLKLLDTAARIAPEIPRVLFAGPRLGGRLMHVPNNEVIRSLLDFGPFPRSPGSVAMVSQVGLVPASVREHHARRRHIESLGASYLPGRVSSLRVLAGLAESGAPAAFVYSDPRRFPQSRTR